MEADFKQLSQSCAPSGDAVLTKTPRDQLPVPLGNARAGCSSGRVRAAVDGFTALFRGVSAQAIAVCGVRVCLGGQSIDQNNAIFFRGAAQLRRPSCDCPD